MIVIRMLLQQLKCASLWACGKPRAQSSATVKADHGSAYLSDRDRDNARTEETITEDHMQRKHTWKETDRSAVWKARTDNVWVRVCLNIL